MPTYADYAHQAWLKDRRAKQDAVVRARHAAFDLMAQDNTPKSDRPSFIVVTASEAFRTGWDRIFASSE